MTLLLDVLSALLWLYAGGAAGFFVSERSMFFELEEDPIWRRALCWPYAAYMDYINLRDK